MDKVLRKTIQIKMMEYKPKPITEITKLTPKMLAQSGNKQDMTDSVYVFLGRDAYNKFVTDGVWLNMFDRESSLLKIEAGYVGVVLGMDVITNALDDDLLLPNTILVGVIAKGGLVRNVSRFDLI